MGTKIASTQQLATRLSVSRGTVSRAIDHLTARGVVEGVQGSGVFVRRLPDDDDLTLGMPLEKQLSEMNFALNQMRSDVDDQGDLLAEIAARLADLYARIGAEWEQPGQQQQKRRKSG